MLRQWLDTWSGLGAVVDRMRRLGYDLALTHHANTPLGWRAFVLSGWLPSRQQVRRCPVPDALAGGPECRVDDALSRAASVSIMARILRQFEAPHELVTLQKVIALPALPTMGARLYLLAQGVEMPLEVVALTLRSEPDGPDFLPPTADLFLAYEPLAAAELVRAGGRRPVASP